MVHLEKFINKAKRASRLVIFLWVKLVLNICPFFISFKVLAEGFYQYVLLYHLYLIGQIVVLKNGYIPKYLEWRWGIRLDFFKSEMAYIIPFLQQLCQLNIAGRCAQEKVLEETIGKNYKFWVFEKEYSDATKQQCIKNLKNKDLVIKKQAVDLLFKLSILEDGIRNDEWYMIMQLMTQLGFNVHYINYFKSRYTSLRTEFDEYARNGRATSSTEYSVVLLKPYYSELGLSENATDEEIKRAYHALALEHHPDLPKNAGRVKECEEKMAKINLAYEKVMG